MVCRRFRWHLSVSMFLNVGFLLAMSRPMMGGPVDEFSTDRRVLWTSSRVQGSPEPPDPYYLEVAFPHLSFDSPIDMMAIPGTDRLAIVEQKRGIWTFRAGDESQQRADPLWRTPRPWMDVFAVAFHPDFVNNGWVYFTHSGRDNVQLARVRCTIKNGVPRAEPDSKQTLYAWPTGGHTGGCVRFGPDGYLYVATGDGSGYADTNLYAQDITDPRGAILRLDVDQTDGDQLYRVPADNPFVDVPRAVPEIFAYGLRQPWKFCFDDAGRLWTGDVGQDLWEMVHVIRKGGNYGWSLMEGTHPFRPERVQGPTEIIPPIVEHHHSEFRSVTGGFVYNAARLEELRGAYIYGDFDTGRIWSVRYDGQQVTEHRQLASSRKRVVAFGQDLEGEVYVVGYASGRIYRLQRSPVATDRPEFPRKLSETGLFASTADHVPAAGVIPYSINAPNVVDDAVIQRFLALPGNGQIEFDALTYPVAPGSTIGWRFPDGTVLMQTLSIPTGDGRLHRVETRIFHHERMPGEDDNYGTQIWNGYSFVWSDDQQDAELVDDPGLEHQLTIVDATTGVQRQRKWHIPSRSQCAACHNIAGKHVLGMNTRQMNRELDNGTGPGSENQLEFFERLGLFTHKLPQRPSELPRLARYTDERQSIDDRARSYLHANCSHCHRQWGGGNSSFQLQVNLPLSDTNVIGARPAHGTFALTGAKLIAPGDPYHSVVFYRMLSIGSARMPRLGAATVHEAGTTIIHDWIAAMDDNAADANELAALPHDLVHVRSEATTTELMDQWLADTARSLRLVHAIHQGQLSDEAMRLLLGRVETSAESHVRDLFDRFLPEEKRVQRLGDQIDRDEILSLEADAQRGYTLFFETTSLQCKNCHQINGQGINVGPDLSRIGKEYDRLRLFDSIVYPSREVKPEYRVVVVETTDGRVLTGLRVPENSDDVVLKDAENRVTRVAAAAVEQVVPQQKSLMPDAQIRSLTAQQLADLIAYLSSLK